jgi:hypothetical protein
MKKIENLKVQNELHKDTQEGVLQECSLQDCELSMMAVILGRS